MIARTKAAVGILLTLATFLLMPASAAAGEQKYCASCTVPHNGLEWSGWNWWNHNYVWRPIGNLFWVYFNNQTYVHNGLVIDDNNNPIHASGYFGYSYGELWNRSGHSVYPVTGLMYT
jgi:hypothetical protein